MAVSTLLCVPRYSEVGRSRAGPVKSLIPLEPGYRGAAVPGLGAGSGTVFIYRRAAAPDLRTNQ
jgi:hypothetical protein